MTMTQPDPFQVLQDLASTQSTDVPSSGDRRAYGEDLARRHRAALDALTAIGADNGGGLAGVARGLLDHYESRQIVTRHDRERLSRVLDLLGTSAGLTLGNVEEVRQVATAVIDDDASSLTAVVVANVALEGIDHETAGSELVTEDEPDTTVVVIKTAVVIAADTVGVLVGGTFGLLGSLYVGVGASLTAAEAIMRSS
jgi:hypothetical protein